MLLCSSSSQNQFKPVQQNKQQVLRAYSPNIYILCCVQQSQRLSCSQLTIIGGIIGRLPRDSITIVRENFALELSNSIDCCFPQFSLLTIGSNIYEVAFAYMHNNDFQFQDRQEGLKLPKILGKYVGGQQCTLKVLIDFCPVQSEFLTWSFVTKTLDILPKIIKKYQI